jgi:D-alanyl-D-alanine carboxypeptidase
VVRWSRTTQITFASFAVVVVLYAFFAFQRRWMADDGLIVVRTVRNLLDGSGLARANTIRPLDLAAVDYAARHTTHGDRFLQSLTVYANGTIRAKRGAMSGVRTEVGFLTTPSGRESTPR